MKFLEKDLEDIIWEAQRTKDGRDALKQRGLNIKGIMVRQLNFGKYGISDLITIHRNSNKKYTITVYELKRNIVNYEAFGQACRYVAACYNYSRTQWPNLEFDFDIVLIGSNVDVNTDFSYISSNIKGISVYTYCYSFEGITFTKYEGGADTQESPYIIYQLPDLEYFHLRKLIDND